MANTNRTDFSTALATHITHAWAILKDAGAGFGRNGGMAAAGNMAFLAMFCLFPFIIFMISLSGMLGQSEKGLEAIAFILSLLPTEVSTAIQKPLYGVIKTAGGEILTFSILFALMTAANGIEAAREIVIRSFGRKFGHAFWKRRLESLAFVIIASLLVLLSMSIQVMGPPVVAAINSLFPDMVTDQIMGLWRLIALAISPMALLLGLYILYLALTPRTVYRPYRLPGAFLTLVIFLSTAKGLSVFLKYAGTYNVTYGSLAGVVIVQLFCYIVSLGFIFGSEFNAAWTRFADRLHPKETTAANAATQE